MLYLGEVIEYSTSEELYHNPRHPYTKELLRSIPQISGDARLSTANREDVYKRQDGREIHFSESEVN